MANEVELTEIDSLNDNLDPVQYPCVIVDGVTTENEFFFFRDRTIDNPEICLPMYFECEGELVQLGQFPLCLEYLLTLRSIGDYKVTLCKSEQDRTPIDLNDPNVLMKFIKL